jgi:hypothetical protein
MDRHVNQDLMSFQDNVVEIDLVFTAGTSGAVPSSFTFGAGVKGVAVSGNNYVVTLQDGYRAFLSGSGGVLQASYSASGACHVNVSADASSATTPTLTLSCYEANGTACLMATGDILHYTFRMKR